MTNIFLDNASTTKVRKEVVDIMLESMEKYYANADSIHDKGIEVSKKIKEAKKIFENIGIDSNRVYFTAGGAEANNIIIQSIARMYKKAHIITTLIEHPSLLETVKHLKEYEYTLLSVDKNGFVNEEELLSSIREDTVLVSIAYVNSELGTIQDIENLAKKVKNKNKNIVFHTDFVQGLGHIDINFKNTMVDAISFSSHKIYGPKGIGALYISKKINVKKIVYGANVENEFVPRTMPNELVFGFLKAISLLKKDDINYLQNLKDYTINRLNEIDDILINTPKKSSPAILNIAIKNTMGEIILNYLSDKGIYVSTGSACSSKKSSSYVIEAINIDKEYSKGVIRISFSINNTKKEIDKFIEELKNIVGILRK